MKTKRQLTKKQLREQLSASLDMLQDRLRLVLNEFDDEDAIALEYAAHALEGLSSWAQDAANLAGELAYAIDPKVAEKD